LKGKEKELVVVVDLWLSWLKLSYIDPGGGGEIAIVLLQSQMKKGNVSPGGEGIRLSMGKVEMKKGVGLADMKFLKRKKVSFRKGGGNRDLEGGRRRRGHAFFGRREFL